MAARLELWEPCLNCGSRDIVEMHGHAECMEIVSDRWDSCRFAHVCKYIVGAKPLCGEKLGDSKLDQFEKCCADVIDRMPNTLDMLGDQ